MKISLKSFALGFVCAAVSLGAVTYVNAAGDATIKACANKKTGAMRYISKGACKKTETTLTWNQMGRQGAQGIPGATGAKGDIGTSGTNKNLHVIDADGKDLGLLVSHEQNEFTVFLGDTIWDLSIYVSNRASGNLNTYEGFFTDAGCSQDSPIIPLERSTSQPVLNMGGRVWKVISVGEISSQATIYENTNGTCTRISSARISLLNDTGYRIAVVEELQPPRYTAPLSIVTK